MIISTKGIKRMVNYSNSQIYKLCCNDTEITYIYIGSTTNFSRRKSAHKSSCCKENGKSYNYRVYQFIRSNGGWDNWDMVQIEAYEAKDKHDLHSRERYWIEMLKPSLNKQIPTRTQKEYREDNKDKITVKGKEYRENNKESITAYKKEYIIQRMEKHQKQKLEKSLVLI
jgi:predicted GIY-YIG superfamily endonuclease